MAHTECVSLPLSLPDDAGDARLSGQQREHGVVAVVLVQTVLAQGLVVDGSLAVQEGEGQVAVGVLGWQRASGREGQLVVVAAVMRVFLPCQRVRAVRAPQRRAQLGVSRRQGGGCGRGHGDGRDGLQVGEGAGFAGVQCVIGEGLLGAAVRHGVAELLPEARAGLVALRAVPVHHAQTFNGLF